MFLLRRKPLIAVLASTFALSAAAQSSPPKRGDIDRPSHNSATPVVGDYDDRGAVTSEGPDEKLRRKSRERRYAEYTTSVHNNKIEDHGLLVDGQPESTDMIFVEYVTDPAAIDQHGTPTSTSTTIILGTVVSAESHVDTATHTAVYSDYRVRVDEVLKPDPAANLAVGSMVVASRLGGAIRLPSGHLRKVFYMGQGLPRIGAQYVLFLVRTILNQPEYTIIHDSGYEIRGGKVYPLDDSTASYEGTSATALLDKLRSTVRGTR